MRNVENQARDSIWAPSEQLDAAVSLIRTGPDAPPGACLAVSRAGEIACSASGVAQAFDDQGPLRSPPPMTIDTRTDLGSVTKVLATSSSMMALVAGDGLLQRRLEELLPWTAAFAVGASDVEQLLQHRAGLWEWWPLYLSAADPADALRVAAGLPLRYAPAAAYHYSDLGFQLLGAVVACVGGTDLAAAVEELVLAPLGLSATRFGRPADGAAVAASSSGDRIERAMVDSGDPYPVTVADAPGGFSWREQVIVGEVNDGNAFHAFDSVAGHAGLFSTARDLLRFGDALLASLAGEGHFDAEIAKRFLQPGREPSQGLGFRCWQTSHGPAWGHTGFPGVAMAVLPQTSASVVLVTNRLHVTGTPRATDEMWMIALRAACEQIAERAQRR